MKKIITAEEAKTMMRVKFNKREKRLINRCVRRATKRGYRYADFYESSFKVSHSELQTLFEELGYEIHFFSLYIRLSIVHNQMVRLEGFKGASLFFI